MGIKTHETWGKAPWVLGFRGGRGVGAGGGGREHLLWGEGRTDIGPRDGDGMGTGSEQGLPLPGRRDGFARTMVSEMSFQRQFVKRKKEGRVNSQRQKTF